MNIPVFDLHCDTALALLGSDLRQCGSLKTNQYHIDLDRAGRLPAYAQCFACFTTDNYEGVPAVDVFERELAAIQRELEKHSDLIRQAYCADDLLENQKNGVMSAVLSIEGPAGFGYDPDLLYDLYLVGFRMTTLGWNESNPLTGSCVTGGGLSDLGKKYVKKAQSLGMVIDVSHISDEGFWDIMNITSGPIVASHSNSRAVCDVSRNLTDDMFKAICDTNGVAGINLYADFVGGKRDLDSVCQHILHFLEIDPNGDHIALGGDLDGCAILPDGFSGVQDYPILADCLLAHGLSEATVKNIFWNNAVEVIRRCCT